MTTSGRSCCCQISTRPSRMRNTFRRTSTTRGRSGRSTSACLTRTGPSCTSDELTMGRTAGIWPYVCLAPALVLFLLLEILPALGTSVFSLTDYTGLPNAPIHWVGIENYTSLLAGQQTFLVRALVVTAIFSLAVTALQNGFAVLIAWLLNSR